VKIIIQKIFYLENEVEHTCVVWLELQTTVSTSSFQMVLDDGAVHKDYKPERASCAAVILDLRVRPTNCFSSK